MGRACHCKNPPHCRAVKESEMDMETDSTSAFPAGGDIHVDRPRSPRRSWQPPAWLTWGLFVILIFLALTLAYLQDSPEVWDDDLSEAYLTKNDAEMTSVVRMKMMLQSANQLELGALPNNPPWWWDEPDLISLLEQSGSILDNFRDLLEDKEQEWQPLSLLWRLEDYGEDPGWSAILLIKQAEASYLARIGDEQAAMRAAVDMAVLARLVQRLDAWPSFMERSLDLHAASARVLAELLRTTQLSESELRYLQLTEYEPWEPSLKDLSQSMRGYYCFERKLLLGPELGEPDLPPGYVPARAGWIFFKPNSTLQLFADSFREIRDGVELPVIARSSRIQSNLRHRMANPWGIANPNTAGEDYFASRVGYYVDLPDRVTLARARYNLVMTLFAFRRCVAAGAKMPQKLEDLVPTFLPVKLMDPFSGTDLCYDPLHGAIYSVGTNLKDEGGRPTFMPMSDDEEPTVETGIGMARKVK